MTISRAQLHGEFDAYGEAGNSALTSSIFYGLAGIFCLCANTAFAEIEFGACIHAVRIGNGD